MKIKKGIPLIDQHDKNGFYGGKFGGNYIAETLKKPIDEIPLLIEKGEIEHALVICAFYFYNQYLSKGH